MNENYNNEIFSFGNENMEDVNQPVADFNYNTISGLGESNYENEDLFKVEEDVPEVIIEEPIVQTNTDSSLENDFRVGESNEIVDLDISTNNSQIGGIDVDNYQNIEQFNYETDNLYLNPNEVNVFNTEVETVPEEESNDMISEESVPESIDTINQEIEPVVEESEVNEYEDQLDTTFENQEEVNGDVIEDYIEQESINNVEPIENELVTDESNVIDDVGLEELPKEPIVPTVDFGSTPIEELTEYEPENIESTDINTLFDRVSVNVKDASDIFRKNTEMKQKIDSRFDELKKLQIEVENSKKSQLDEVNNYKEEVLNKLTEKKEEIEKRLNTLKELQASLEKEKKEFEEYKRREQEKIDRVQKDIQAAYDDRREELNHVEEILRKQKDSLDEERNQLSLDRIQYESDKNDLANNLLKFNELVNSFTTGMNNIEEQ